MTETTDPMKSSDALVESLSRIELALTQSADLLARLREGKKEAASAEEPTSRATELAAEHDEIAQRYRDTARRMLGHELGADPRRLHQRLTKSLFEAENRARNRPLPAWARRS